MRDSLIGSFALCVLAVIGGACAFDTSWDGRGAALSALPRDPACACEHELEAWLLACIDDTLGADVGEGYRFEDALALCTPDDVHYSSEDAFEQLCAVPPDRVPPRWCGDGIEAFVRRHVPTCVDKLARNVDCR